MLELSISSLSPFCAAVHVVTGYNAEEVEALVKHIENTSFIFNPDYDQGMFSSVLTGLRAVNGDRCLLLPGDCPFVPHEIPKRMLDGASRILIPTYKGEAGHPVLLSREIIDLLLKGSDAGSLHEFLMANSPDYLETDCPEVLIDIDTAAEYMDSLILTSLWGTGGRV